MDPEILLAELPRTECQQCGYPGCAPYAAAMSEGRAGPDDCAPGGAWVRNRLRSLLGHPREVAAHVLAAPFPSALRARIDEEWCIGCTKCIDACPVDAIIGGAHQLHGVLAAACTGCGLCMPPCPVECIELVPAPAPPVPVADSARIAEHAPCSPCGRCAPVCPEALDPARLFDHLSTLDLPAALDARMTSCTECAKCDEVCPSRIPLSAYFSAGKRASAATGEARAAARLAVARTSARQRRMARAPDHAASGVLPVLAAIARAPAGREIAAAVARVKANAAVASAAGES